MRWFLNLFHVQKNENGLNLKQTVVKQKGIGEYISSHSNAVALFGEKYGYLVWGINDKTLELVAITFDYTVDVKNEPLQHYLERQIHPDNNFSFNEVYIDCR